MKPHYVVVAVFFVAGLATACSAFIGLAFTDTDAYDRDGSSVGSGTSSGGTSGAAGSIDPCDLRKSEYSEALRDANACSDCITTQCYDEVKYACGDGGSSSTQPWFSNMRNCAQDPWNGYAPPGETDRWGCTFYDDLQTADLERIPSNGDESEHARDSQICVYTKCLYVQGHPCRQCDVNIGQTGAPDKRAYLRNDPCGKCLQEHCKDLIDACCDQAPMDDFIAKCAYTNDPVNLETCNRFMLIDASDGPEVKYYADFGKPCARDLQKCFIDNCGTLKACQPE